MKSAVFTRESVIVCLTAFSCSVVGFFLGIVLMAVSSSFLQRVGAPGVIIGATVLLTLFGPTIWGALKGIDIGARCIRDFKLKQP